MTRKRTIAASVAAAITLALAAYAVAAEQPATVASYTGCLRNGKIESVALGDAPLAPCAAGAIQIRLGGGDITGVHARQGLLGGGENGDLELGVDPTLVQKRVSGDCLGIPLVPRDASISAIHEDGTVSCNTDDQTDVIAGFADGPRDLPVGSTLQQIAELPLPKGKYAILAVLGILPGGSTGSFDARCQLRAETDFDRAALDVNGTFVPSSPHVGRLSLNVVHEFKDAGKAVLSCASFAGAQWHTLKITAIGVASLSNAPLTLP